MTAALSHRPECHRLRDRRADRRRLLEAALRSERCEDFVRASGPLRRALAALSRRFVEQRGWEPLGFARSGDYARERLGLSARSLQDLALVDRRLADLPVIEKALASGTLTWTKTRYLCRAAQPENEAKWVAFALRVTARQLSHEVRAAADNSVEAHACSTDEDGAPAEHLCNIRIRCSRSVRARWFFARQLARRVAGEEVPLWQAAEWIAAEVLSALPLDAETAAEALLPPPLRHPAEEGRNLSAPQGPGEQTWQDGGASRCVHADLLKDLDGADAFDLDRRLRRVVALERCIAADQGEHLLRVAEAHLAPNMEHYARERLGISPRKARGLLRLARAGRRVPALRRAWHSGKISWAQAQTLVPAVLAEPSRAAEWITRSAETTVRRLEEEVESALASTERQAGAPPDASATDSEDCELFWCGPVDSIRIFRAVLVTVRRRLALPSDGLALEVMLDHAIREWSGGQRRKKERKAWRVFARDGWRCAVPGCTSYRNLHDHHIEFRSRGGSDDESNRITLCAWHHLRGVHGGRPSVRVAGTAPDHLRFELGVRSGQMPLAAYGPCETYAEMR